MRERKDRSKRTLHVLAAAAFLLGLTWQHVQAVKLGYEVEKSRRSLRILQAKIGARQSELERSLTPVELASRAKSLGLCAPPPTAVRVLGAADAAREHATWLARLLTPWRNLAG